MTVSVQNGETGKPRWRTGEKHGARSQNERDLFGALTMGELVRREQAVLDETPTRALCVFCDWTFSGTAVEAREAGAAHRTEQHPEREFTHASRKPKRAASFRTLNLDTLTDQPDPADDEAPAVPGQKEPPMLKAPTEPTTPGPDEPPPVGASSAEPSSGGNWSRRPVPRQEAIELFQAEVAELGHVPTKQGWKKLRRRPSLTAIERHAGSYTDFVRMCGLEPTPNTSAAVEAAGYPRPVMDRPTPKPKPKPKPTVTVEESVERETSTTKLPTAAHVDRYRQQAEQARATAKRLLNRAEALEQIADGLQMLIEGHS